MTGRVAVGVLLVGAGGLGLLSSAGVVDLSFRTWIGLLLIAIGVAIAVVPGSHGLLVTLGVLIALAGLPALLVDEDLVSGGIGEALETPTSRAELAPFRQGIGKLTIDLTAPGLELEGAEIEGSIGIGELAVLVPDDVDVALDAHVGIGNVEAFGETESGIDVDLERLSGTSGTQEVGLKLDVGIGNVRVVGP